MRIVTWNVNGLRAALRKGFAEQLDKINPDVLLLQEVRALPEQLPKEWVEPAGWHVHWHPAERKGYAGVAVWSREPFEVLGKGLGEVGGAAAHGSDPEGRVLRIRCGGVQIVSVYLPSGSSGDERQAIKEQWLGRFAPWAGGLLGQREPVILGGDFNIAHTEQDIFHAKSNEQSSGFLPHEREWLGNFKTGGWRDFVREHYGERHGPYTWWSNRGQARALDRGWRIDYLFGNAAAAKQFGRAEVHREAGLEISDHAPVSIDLK